MRGHQADEGGIGRSGGIGGSDIGSGMPIRVDNIIKTKLV